MINLNKMRLIDGLSGILGIAITAGIVTPAQANIVENPGFEADAAILGSCGDIIPNGTSCNTVTDWSISGTAGEEDNAVPNSGTVNAFLGTGTLSQTLDTVSGASYTISFYLAADSNTLNAAVDSFFPGGGEDALIDASFGSTDLGTTDAVYGFLLSSASAGQYFEEVYTNIAASSASSLLAFAGSNDSGLWYIDDVDVECTADCGTVVAAPEPSSLPILAAALGAAAIIAGARRAGWWRRA
jgi:hypothetical protein